ncbi:hypothetical protein BS47DRAFT_1356931 [Hydnum rufescens UP504]|uniref:Uncharacterized protein n=1 Tax=Hydnum rufescens UP504 TaxID=1448309 RepID=A0A9P6E2B7_9AGAM|nr:hypothetical protein BS47DRAFT_1356931 [Hydnum rufescens UP504]
MVPHPPGRVPPLCNTPTDEWVCGNSWSPLNAPNPTRQECKMKNGCPFSHYEILSKASTDKAQGVVKSSTFSHCETPPKAAEMKTRAKHGRTQAPESPAPKHP